VRAVVTRVSSAAVSVGGRRVAQLPAPGLLVLLGVTHGDGPDDVAWLARKVWTLRMLEGEESASETAAPVLVVSQFTLYGDARKGRRPSWTAAAPAEVSEPLYESFCKELTRLGADVGRGVFGEHMEVASVNDGPVTILLETPSRD